MSQSLLIFGGNKNTREKELFKDISNNKSPDVFILEPEKEKKSIGIEQVRICVKFLQEKPFELRNKYLIIPQAEKLTREAQNALLKVLEEPPVYADIRLGTKAEQDLLETVISRCKRIDIKNRVGDIEKKEESSYSDYALLKKMSIGERLDFIDDLSKEEREDIIEILENWMEKERTLLIGTPNNTKSIKALIQVREDLENTNINTKLSLEYLVINI